MPRFSLHRQEADQVSPESVAASSDQPDASATEAELPPSDAEEAVEAETPVAPEEAESDADTAASDVVEQSTALNDAEAPKAELEEPLENTVSIEPVAETLGQGEES